jgi:cellulose synthase/poly-beta-1,6-N-acetylglucosamine synthase-like glycosyltransferase
MPAILLTVFLLVCLLNLVFIGFELRLLFGDQWQRRRQRTAAVPSAGCLDRLPTVLVQIPLYNEGAVALPCLDAACSLDYPRDLLEIQVLDDSTDQTPDLLAPVIERWRAAGIAVTHLRRSRRDGWKAGALAHGLARSTAEFVVVCDADFALPPGFLGRVFAAESVFADPAVAFLQGRWTFSNRDRNLLTRAQALLINRHFSIQKPFQSRTGRIVTFNGSAGVFRRSAIDRAGGWSADTVCEDLDLSYRCGLAGLRGTYDFALTCPSELPAGMLAFKLQQRRWAKGTVQCLRKFGTDVLLANPNPHRWDDLYALSGYFLQPMTLAYLVLLPWIVCQGPASLAVLGPQVLMTLGHAFAISGLVVAASRCGRRLDAALLRELAAAVALGVGLTVNTTVALVAGAIDRTGTFERTPKQGDGPAAAATTERLRLHWSLWLELALLAYMLGASATMVGSGFVAQGLAYLAPAACLAGSIVPQLLEGLAGRAAPSRAPATSSRMGSGFALPGSR